MFRYSPFNRLYTECTALTHLRDGSDDLEFNHAMR